MPLCSFMVLGSGNGDEPSKLGILEGSSWVIVFIEVRVGIGMGVGMHH